VTVRGHKANPSVVYPKGSAHEACDNSYPARRSGCRGYSRYRGYTCDAGEQNEDSCCQQASGSGQKSAPEPRRQRRQVQPELGQLVPLPGDRRTPGRHSPGPGTSAEELARSDLPERLQLLLVGEELRYPPGSGFGRDRLPQVALRSPFRTGQHHGRVRPLPRQGGRLGGGQDQQYGRLPRRVVGRTGRARHPQRPPDNHSDCIN